MHKRFLCGLLALVMVTSMVILPVRGEKEEPENVTAASEICPCGCGQQLDQLNWIPWDPNNEGDPASGHYYLDGDYAQEGQRTVISGNRVVLDLRGNTLTSKEYSRLFLIYGYVAVLDTVGGGRLQSKTSGGAYGGVVMISNNETLGATFELHSGTLTVDPDNKGSLRGGIVSVGKHCIFRMTGGIVSGGNTKSDTSGYLQGGGIAVIDKDAMAEITGGTLMNCSAQGSGGIIYSVGTTILKNCRILNGRSTAYGGNVCQSGGSLTMENCELAYGTATGTLGGGNLYAASCTFTDEGSVIRDGYAEGGTGNGGGNILFGAGTHTLTGTTVKGGVTRKYGANILNWAASTTRMIDCNIDGDVRWSGDGLSLEGQTKIGLRSNGLNLVGGSAGSVISASKLTEGAEIFVSAIWGTFTNDDADLNYFKPALRTVLKKNANGTLSGSEAAAGAEGGYCPHCYDPANPQKVTWTAFTATTDSNVSQSGHYYLSGAVTARLNIAADTDVVIDLNGKSFTSGHRCLVLKKGATLSLLDFNGAGKVTGKGGVDWSGGVIYGEGASDLNIYGGTYIYSSLADKHIKTGGVIHMPSGSNVNIYGGSFDGSSYNKVDSGYVGGAVNMADGAKSFTMSAGRIIGGNAYQAGSVVFGKSVDVEITGGVISGGSVTNSGGNIRFAGAAGAKGTATMENCAVLDGTTSGASGYSGNMHIYYYTVDMDNCFISGGVNEKAYGGNIACSSGSKTTAKDTIFVGGKAARGGNFYMTTTDLTASFTDCMILDGYAAIPTGSTSTNDGNGGNLFINNGVITVSGGVIAGGHAERLGGNIHNNTGNNTDGNKLVFRDSETKPVVYGGRAGTYGGNIHLYGVAELTSVYIAGGQAVTAGDDLYFNNGAKFSVALGAGLTGNISAAVVSALFGEGTYGQPVTGVTTEQFSAQITLKNVTGKPKALAEGGKLVVAGVSVIDLQGQETWYADNASAMEACGQNAYVKLYTDKPLTLTRDLTVDLNGQTVAVSGDYTLFGMDSTGDGYAVPTGKAIGAQAADITYAPNGNLYLAVEDGDGLRFHRLGMALTDVVLRPADAGMYYQAAWSADSVLKPMIAEYGIVASLAHMPDATFRNDETSQSVGFTTAIVNDTKQCGVLIKDIMQTDNDAAQNKQNGETPIYATAYVTLTDGRTFVSDRSYTPNDDMSHSLYTFMECLDTLIRQDPTHFREFERAVKEFYAVWEEKGMGDWTFERLKAPEDPAEDGILNVLMIGSSGCYYYVEELYALLKEAGIESRICNVYYSGGLLSQHYNWWKKDLSNYQFYVTDKDGRRLVKPESEPASSLEFCLAYANWDVITLQESGTGKLREQSVQAFLTERKVYLDSLYGYLGQEFPQAELMWHENGSYQVGYNKSFQVNSLADQIADTQNFRRLAQGVADTYGVRWIPRGEGSLNFRQNSGLPDTLCARLGYGTNHEGDYYHDGDIGGGQLLTACIWFESLSGLSCLNSNYVPVYTYKGETFTLSDELVAAVRTAAHEAVQTWFVPQ